MYNHFFVFKKLLINGLTLSRIPITIIFNFSLFYGKNKLFICSLLFLIIALTDFFDGKLARYYNVTSSFGAVLDISTDFFFIFSASCLLYIQSLLPIGLIILIAVKFAEFCFTSYLINKKLNINKALFFDKIGRLVAIMLYSFPIFALALHTFLQRSISNLIILYTILLITGLSAISIYRRVLRLTDVKSEM
ncbi:MAG: CDP-alcohol phosphatidyltransferase family protein [Catonella sp.]|uniref:CDP-alcohol phosphatidyltransferase family protein n=1 Tax=Catonella sp. TaxID=2382125 RepID=UPI003FA022EF